MWKAKDLVLNIRTIFNCAGDSWALLYYFKPEKPNGWKSYLWRQRSPADWRHRLVTQTGDLGAVHIHMLTPVPSAVWLVPHTAQHCLIYSFDCIEDRSSFGRDPCHPSAHSSTDTNYMRGIQHLICIFHILQKHIKRHHVLFTFDIYTRLKCCNSHCFKKKQQLQSEVTLWLKYQMETKECNFSLFYTHFKTVHNRILFWT